MVLTAAADPRVRAAATKRRRSRDALVAAAGPRFAQLGWAATRMEDIAHDAGVGSATAYSHFTKQTLIGHVYAPLFQPLLAAATTDIANHVDPRDALTRHVHDTARLTRHHRNLTIALLSAIQERTLTVNAPPRAGDTDDVRVLVPAPAPMIELIAYGQRAGVFTAHPDAPDVASYHTNALFLRVVTRPRDTAPSTARMVLSQLLPALLTDAQTVPHATTHALARHART